MENKTPINSHQMVLDRVETHLAIQMESAMANVKGEQQPRELTALNSVLAYPPIAYLTKAPDYISDIEQLDQESQNWIINFANYVTIDWSMMVRTINGDDDYMESFINALSKTITSLVDTAITPDGYGERLDKEKVNDPVALTYFMLATCYRRIALNVGVAHGRASSTSIN